MANTTAIRNVVGIIGNVISFILFASPIPTFVKIVKNKSVEEFKPDPYLATMMNCLLWIFYGLPMVQRDTLVVTNNSIGLTIEVAYTVLFFIYSQKQNRLKVIGWVITELVFVAIVVVCTLLIFPTNAKRALFVGILCIIFCVMMYVAPLTVMANVVKTKSVEYMPFTLSLAAFFNTLIWVVYSVMGTLDINILISNGIGLVFTIAQLVLYAMYYKSTPKDEKTKVQMSELPVTSPSPKAIQPETKASDEAHV
ncbi:SWEET sugar transporter [Dillenia turbinata]|uniref:Bidirectional sugar transporter SWEET n=1 Tax=Dillenia turbinata TaxID=194707 RepID=A0AAN8UML0_9MAGN